MTPGQIALLAAMLIQLGPMIPSIVQWATNEIQNNENLTPEEKAPLIQRIKDAQAMIPDWK